jgi:Tc toxin complex TcA C-terminal TcB-binding domain
VPIDGAARPDRKGLTGSARLLADIIDLDQQAFLTDRRKLQLTRTISLARLAPVELERFRQSGIMVFATPEEMFDRDFPGHYLRLIKRVRTSMIALVPPTEGIRANLSTPGFSRVVVGGGAGGGDAFRSMVVRRAPETVALSSTRDATCLFDLGVDPQPELLLPFEGGGVDTVWQLELPKAANPFDFKTIADVLFTLEYTALHSSDYRQQVIRALDPVFSADRPFRLRQEFPDQWYELHNHDQSSTPMTVRFTTSRADFPPNLHGLDIEHLVLSFARADGNSFEISNAELYFTPSGSQQARGGLAGVSADGVISTRRTNGET